MPEQVSLPRHLFSRPSRAGGHDQLVTPDDRPAAWNAEFIDHVLGLLVGCREHVGHRDHGDQAGQDTDDAETQVVQAEPGLAYGVPTGSGLRDSPQLPPAHPRPDHMPAQRPWPFCRFHHKRQGSER